MFRRLASIGARQGRKPRGFALIVGLFLSSVLDPRTKPATEQLDRAKRANRTEPGRENA